MVPRAAGIPGIVGAVWRDLDLRARGLQPWRWTIADSHPGLGAAVAEQQPTAAEPHG
jgi:hypothetical protein